MNHKYEVLLYYNYVDIEDPEQLKQSQLEVCNRLNLKGRIIVSKEGINGTVEGKLENTEDYIDFMQKDKRFKNTHFKRSEGNGSAFPKLKIKVRPELVSLHLGDEDINPNQITGKHLDPDELHNWFETNKEFYIIDMRNDYEHVVGQFENSILPKLHNFRDLPEVLPELEHLKDKTILTVCTGGVRCEKASGYLLYKGFKDVYQLNGGIVSYMEKYPNQNFLGKLYVFDSRVVMGFNTDSEAHKIIALCDKCGNLSDNYVDCKYIHCKGHRQYICCNECLEKNENHYCSNKCSQMDLETMIS